MYQVITIEREYCSGGNEIGRMLSKKLNYPIHDHSILVEAARRLEIPAVYISDLEETSSGSIIFNLSQTSLGGHKASRSIPLAEQLFLEEKQIIEDCVHDQSGIIVGRCGSEILKYRDDCLRVFIYADLNFRKARAEETEQLSPRDVDNAILKVDRRRSSFYNIHTGLIWGDPHNFDLCLDSSSLGISGCVDIISSII